MLEYCSARYCTRELPGSIAPSRKLAQGCPVFVAGLVQRLAVGLAPPRRLPRMDFTGQIPERARTMVIVPTLLTSVERVNELLEHLEVQALGNLDPHLHFVT